MHLVSLKSNNLLIATQTAMFFRNAQPGIVTEHLGVTVTIHLASCDYMFSTQETLGKGCTD